MYLVDLNGPMFIKLLSSLEMSGGSIMITIDLQVRFSSTIPHLLAFLSWLNLLTLTFLKKNFRKELNLKTRRPQKFSLSFKLLEKTWPKRLLKCLIMFLKFLKYLTTRTTCVLQLKGSCSYFGNWAINANSFPLSHKRPDFSTLRWDYSSKWSIYLRKSYVESRNCWNQ